MDSLSSISSISTNSAFIEPPAPAAQSIVQPAKAPATSPASLAVDDAPSPTPQAISANPLPANLRYAPSAAPSIGDIVHFDRRA